MLSTNETTTDTSTAAVEPVAATASRAYRVAIIGRPNVGKSTLFNFLTRSRKAVVKDQPGVTRDILVGEADWWGASFEVLDTGGLTKSADTFSALIYQQVMSILKYVDQLIVVMDAKVGLVPEDRDVIRIAKESGKPFFIVLNKVDREQEAEVLKSEFYEFGFDVLHASFERRDHTDEVVEKILAAIPEKRVADDKGVRVAIVGKPNAGKSSLFNAIVGEDRALVSDVAGTTVDAVEERYRYKDQELVMVDTAGLRKQAKRLGRGDGVEIISAYKSYEAIDRSDLVLLVMDATHGPTEQDAKMASYAYEKAKAVVVIANKFDLLRQAVAEPKRWFRERLEREFHFAPDVPVLFTSAARGEGIEDLLDGVLDVWRKINLKIPTRKLNDFFYEVIRQAPSPVYRTTNVKFYYLTQTEQKPPAFIAFANHPKGVTPAYRRFLINRIQKEWGLEGIPVRVFIMKST
jgi:GTP-binding protein